MWYQNMMCHVISSLLGSMAIQNLEEENRFLASNEYKSIFKLFRKRKLCLLKLWMKSLKFYSKTLQFDNKVQSLNSLVQERLQLGD